VFLVTAQTWFIASKNILAVAAFGFAISFVWTLNVRRVSAHGWRESVAYALGASVGAVSGLILGTHITK
jgi:hypothetical protein